MSYKEEPELAIEGGPEWFIRDCYQVKDLQIIPRDYIQEGMILFEKWFNKNRSKEWEALFNMSRNEQYSCILMEIALVITKKETDESARAKYYTVLKYALKETDLIEDCEILETEEGSKDLWMVLSEPRVKSLDHLKTFRVFGRKAFKQSLIESEGKKRLWATMFVLKNQWGRAVGYFTDEDSAINEIKLFRKLKGDKLRNKRGEYIIAKELLDPLNGKVKTSEPVSRHVVR